MSLFQNKIIRSILSILAFSSLMFVISTKLVLAESNLSKIILTQVSPHPTDTNCEYFTLYNISEDTIELGNSNISIKDNTSTDVIVDTDKFGGKLGTQILPQDYALVIDSDCTDMGSVVSNFDTSKLLVLTTGSSIGNGLSNNSDKIEIYLNKVLQDSFSWKIDYGAGKVIRKINLTIDNSDDNWSVDGISLTTYSQTLSLSSTTKTANSTNVSSNFSQSSTSSTVTINAKDLIISEIYPSPDSKLNEKEWVEIYNNTNFQIDLSQFYLQDLSGAKYKLTGFIQANQYLQIFPILSLNNTGDTISLFYSSSLIDKVSYSQTDSEQSWIKSSNSNLTLTCKQTPAAQNISKSCNNISSTIVKNINSQTNSQKISSSITSTEISTSNISLDLNSLDMRFASSNESIESSDINLNSAEVLGISDSLASENSPNYQILAIPILGVAITSIILLIRKSKSDKILL